MGRVAYQSASFARRGLMALWPAVLLTVASILISGTMSYAHGQGGADASVTTVPAQTGLSDHAAKTLTAVMMSGRRAEDPSIRAGATGFSYSAE